MSSTKAHLAISACVLGVSACSAGDLNAVTLRPDDAGPIDAVRDSSDDSCADANCAPSPAGWALQFDGVDDCVQATRAVSKDFTIEGWVLLPDPGNGTYWWEGSPLFWGDTGMLAADFSAVLLNGTLWFVTGSPSGDSLVQTKSIIATSQWVHLAVTRVMDTGRVTLFVNGTADASGTGTTGALSSQPNFWVFCSNTSLFTPGVVDEVRVWSQARSEADIQSTMHKRLQGDEPGLVTYWRFDEGAGTLAADSSPTGNTLVLGTADGGSVPKWVISTAPIESP